MSENKGDLQPFNIEPGSSVRFTNTTSKGLILRVETTLETVVESTLPPGGELTIKCAEDESNLTVFVEDADHDDPGLLEVLQD